MTIEHRLITDPQIHEPKGITTAAANTIYVADGLGSGSWETRYEDNVIFAELDKAATSATLVLNTALKITGMTFDDYTPPYFSLDGAGGRLTVNEAGFYQVNFFTALTPNTTLGANNERVFLDVLINGLPPITPRHVPITVVRNSDNTDLFYVPTSRIIDLNAGDYIEMFLTNQNANRAYTFSAGINLYKIGNL